MSEPTIYWITKYLGNVYFILGYHSKDCPDIIRKHQSSEVFHKPEWHETKEGALLQAKEMIKTKRISLTQEIEKLDQLEKELEQIANA